MTNIVTIRPLILAWHLSRDSNAILLVLLKTSSNQSYKHFLFCGNTIFPKTKKINLVCCNAWICTKCKAMQFSITNIFCKTVHHFLGKCSILIVTVVVKGNSSLKTI